MTTPRHRSAVTNGKRLHVVPAGDTAWARRFKDVLAEITNDLGGVDLLSEGQRQLIRRVATISIACEAMEGDAAAGAAIDLELYGRLTDRLGRALERLGLKRQPREVSGMNGPLPYSPMRARFEAEAAAETEESEMSKDAFYQKTRRECAALLRFDDVDNLTADQATRLDCVVALRLCVDAMQSQLLRGEAVDTNKLLAATQELRRFLPEPEETQITGESARQRLLQVVLNLIAPRTPRRAPRLPRWRHRRPRSKALAAPRSLPAYAPSLSPSRHPTARS